MNTGVFHMGSIKNNIESIVASMTLEEKAALVNGATFFGMSGVERLGIPALSLLDGGTGMNFEQLFGDFCSKESVAGNSTNGMSGSSSLVRVIDNYYHPERLNESDLELYEWIKARLHKLVGGEYSPGCFPCGMMLGATFDPNVVQEMGRALGVEARIFGVNILLGSPNVNIHRDPLNGRLFEGFSEDPCLVSSLAPQLVKGVQEYGIAANVKHFAANNQETNRVGINETITMRALREIYLPGFRACVTEGRVKTVMSAYNAINGVPCSENKWLLTDVLRDEWGFDGAVISDWGAVYHPVEALEAGNDLAMPGPISGEPIVRAVRDGRLDESVLDLAAMRLLELIAFCMECSDKPAAEEFSAIREQTSKAAYEAASAGTVMLKNNDSLFPLADTGEPVLLLGSGAKELVQCGTGSAGITTVRGSDLAQTLRSGLERSQVIVGNESESGRFLSDNPGTRVIFIATLIGMEGNDRDDMFLTADDAAQLEKLCALKDQLGFSLSLVLNVCGPVDISDYEDNLDGVFVCFLPGMEGAHALGDIMIGKRDPSGRLPLTFPRRYEDAPTFLNFPGDGKHVIYGEGIYVGYRYYDKKKIQPAYPFGFGLSYTTFEYSNLTVDRKQFNDELKCSVTVTNTGSRDGAEVVQIYISDPVSSISKPVRELKRFQKVYLQPGQSQRLDFTLTQEDFASFDPDYNEWLAEEGYFDIIAASSSAEKDIRLQTRVYLKNQNQYSYGEHSTVKVMYEHPELRELLSGLWVRQKWDWQIVASNYQYTPNRNLNEIFPEKPLEKNIAWFLESVSGVKHQ